MCLLEPLALYHDSENQVENFMLLQFKMKNLYLRSCLFFLKKVGLILIAALINNKYSICVGFRFLSYQLLVEVNRKAST